MNILVSQGAVDPWCRGPSRWGWTPCCHAPLHSQCLSSWVQRGDAVVKCPSQSDNTYSKAVAKHRCPLCNAQMPTSRVLPFQLEAAQEAEMLAAEVAKKASSDVEMCGESGSKHTYSSLSEICCSWPAWTKYVSKATEIAASMRSILQVAGASTTAQLSESS